MHNSSSSSRKKQPKLSFSSGFRSYVRHFLGAIFVLLRPSVPWCFPIREVSFQQQLKNNSSSSSSSRKKQPKLSFSSGFRSYVRHFLGAIFVLLRPSVPWCFPIRGMSFQQQLKNNSSSSSRKNGFLGFAFPQVLCHGVTREMLQHVPFCSRAHATVCLFVLASDSS